MKKSIRLTVKDNRSDQYVSVNWAPERRAGSVARKCAKMFGHPVVGADWRLQTNRAGRVFSSDVPVSDLPAGLVDYTITEIGHSV